MPIPIGVLAQAGASSVSTTDYDWLETLTVSGSITSLTFSNLNNYSQYKHLQIRGSIRSSGTGQFVEFRMRYNGDTASNYWSHWIEGQSATPTAQNAGPQTSIFLGVSPGGGGTADAQGCFVIDLLDFNNANKSKTARFYTGPTNTTTAGVYFGSGFHLTVGATTSVTLLTASGQLRPNCRFSLYGVK
jgi:hypothetical protein